MNKVSIIIPAFNAGLYISQAIESVIRQTFTNWELIVVDDGSSDDTKEIVSEYVLKDSRIRYLYQQNGKQGKARNLGIRHSSGEYIAFLDADDYWLETKLSKQIAVLERVHDVWLVATNGFSFSEAEARIRSSWCSLGDGVVESEFGLKLMLRSNFVLNSSVILKRKVFDTVSLFSEEYTVQKVEDYDLWIRILESGFSFYFLSEILTAYRVHESQSTADDGYASLGILAVLKTKRYANKSLRREKLKAAKWHFSRSVRKNWHFGREKLRDIILLYTEINDQRFLRFFYLGMLFVLGERRFASFVYRISLLSA